MPKSHNKRSRAEVTFNRKVQTDEALDEARRIRQLAREEEIKARDLQKAGKWTEADECEQRAAKQHAKAAKLFYTHYNQNISDPLTTRDLHGLTCQEALDKTVDLINRTSSGVITIITGRGAHSPNGRANIRDHILDYLKNNPDSYRKWTVPWNNDGRIEITL